MSHPPPPSDSFLAADRVTPRDGSYPAPGNTIPLTFLDAHCINLPYVQHLLLYTETNGIPFHLVVQNLKSALSETLLKFHPLAGKLTYVPSSGDVVVDCSDAGVEFVVAESDGDIKRLAGDPVHYLRAFIDLVPEIDRSSLPLPVMAVKVTGFAGGGVAVGLAVHHTVVDGNGIAQFLQAWSACCRGAAGDDGAVPVHDRALVRHPGGDEIARECLRKYAPELPKLAAPPNSLEDRLCLQRRTFTPSSAAIQSLKRHIADQTGHRLDRPPSTFTSISAIAWVCIAHAKQPSPTSDEVTNLIFFMDCRSRIDPPLPASYTGNCVCCRLTTAKWSELSGSGGISRAHELIACAVREGTQNPFGGGEGLDEGFRQMHRNGMLVTGSPRFSSYQDFGWGNPGRAEMVSTDTDGQVVFDGTGEGAVQVSVTLGPARMVAFAKAFEDLLMSIQQDEVPIGKK